jgi:hypothetical protein
MSCVIMLTVAKHDPVEMVTYSYHLITLHDVMSRRVACSSSSANQKDILGLRSLDGFCS